MPLSSSLKHWSFNGATFARSISGEWQAWFEWQAITQIDPILGASSRVIDVGGATPQPLTVRAVFDDKAARDALCAVGGVFTPTEAVLNNGLGQSCTALLTKAQPVSLGVGGLHAAEFTFEMVV